MARTYRNRHAVPRGYAVRDGGRLFYRSCCRKGAQCDSLRQRCPDRCPCHPRWNECNFRRKIFRTERKAERKAYYRQYRSRVKDRMRHGDWEGIPRFRRTSGWLTW